MKSKDLRPEWLNLVGISVVFNLGLSTVKRLATMDPDFPRPARFSERIALYEHAAVTAYMRSKVVSAADSPAPVQSIRALDDARVAKKRGAKPQAAA